MTEPIISDILNCIKNKLSKNKEIVSLTLVGSFANPDKKLEKFNDIDLVIILDKVTKEKLSKIENIAKEIKEKFEDNKTGITHTFKIGPIKVKSKKKTTVMLHFLVYDPDKYVKYESTLTRHSFQFHNPLIGKPLKTISEIKRITKTDIFNEIDGIPAKKKIVNKIIEYLEPSERAYILNNYHPSESEYSEQIIYSVLRLANDILNLEGNVLKINKEMCNSFQNKVAIRLNSLPLEVLELKNKIRQGYELTETEQENLKLKSKEFIEQCENVLLNLEINTK
ncbi:MAG: nucleotidyltransferase domain-containing protein [Nanoarchaeota archaeon]